MAIDFTAYENTTQKKKAARDYVADAVMPILTDTFSTEEVVKAPYPLELVDSDTGNSKGSIKAGNILICLGQTVNKEGATVDMVMEIDFTVKAIDTVKRKDGKTIYAVNFDDVLEAIDKATAKAKAKAAEKRQRQAKSKK